MEEINFFGMTLQKQPKQGWMRLDNAAKIFPAAKRKNWSNVFRLSITLSEKIDADILQSALEVTVKRFPSIAVRVRHGLFWYYLEEIRSAPKVKPERRYPLTNMPFDDIGTCAFRVLYYENRIAVEFFHALTDGNGGLVFLKTLAAEYLTQKYGITVSDCDGVLNRFEGPNSEELEDSFLKNEGDYVLSRKDEIAYHVTGTPEPDGFLHVTTGILDADEVLQTAKSYGVSLTVLMTAVMLAAITDIQAQRVPLRRKQKPVKVQIPVNLRKLFDSKTLRNFVYCVSLGINPRMGDYSFDEIVKSVRHQMGVELSAKRLQARFTANVRSEKRFLLKITPLFLKNIVMKAVFDCIGENAGCLSLSNLGAVRVPVEMVPYVSRIDFVLGVQAAAPYNCGMVTYADKLYINFIRNTLEPELEQRFFTRLLGLGIHVKVESNQR